MTNETNVEPTWTVVSNKKVRCVWKCHACLLKEYVSPEWYEDNGTPVCCECDRDMSYIRTEVAVKILTHVDLNVIDEK